MKKYQVIKREWNQFARKFFESVTFKDIKEKKEAEILANEFNSKVDSITEIYEVREQEEQKMKRYAEVRIRPHHAGYGEGGN